MRRPIRPFRVLAPVFLCIAAAAALTPSSRAALYFNTGALNEVYRVDTATGAGTSIGHYREQLGISEVALSPTADPDVLLASTWTHLSRFRISTGNYSIVGPLAPRASDGLYGGTGMGFDATTGRHYGIVTNDLYRFDPVTGQRTATLAPAPTDEDNGGLVYGLTYARGKLYGVEPRYELGAGVRYLPSRMHVYDIAAGTWAAPVTMDFLANGPIGLAYNPDAGLFYMAASNATDPALDRLYTLDPATFKATLVGKITENGYEGGLAYVSVPEPTFVAGVLLPCAALLARRGGRTAAPCGPR